MDQVKLYDRWLIFLFLVLVKSMATRALRNRVVLLVLLFALHCWVIVDQLTKSLLFEAR